MEQLKSTPLSSHHRALGALMAPFGGWDMPIQYEGIIAEHRACRQQAALFDICHMGEFIFSGDIVADGLEDVFTFSVASIPIGRSRYGFLLNEAGGIIDDLIVFRLAEDKAMIVVNAATADNDFEVIASRLERWRHCQCDGSRPASLICRGRSPGMSWGGFLIRRSAISPISNLRPQRFSASRLLSAEPAIPASWDTKYSSPRRRFRNSGS